MKTHFIDVPDLLALNRYNPDKYPFLLENNSSNNIQSNQSFLFTHPQESIVLSQTKDFDFLAKLAIEVKKNNQETATKLPFIGGYFVYFSYEFIAEIEPKLTNNTQTSATPIAYAVRIDSAIIIDHKTNSATIVEKNGNQVIIDEILSDIVLSKTQKKPIKKIIANVVNTDLEKFIKQVKKIKQYIVSGDVFQVNLSRLWQITLKNNETSADIYQTLASKNPAPFSALATFLGFDIISSSPERLFCVNDNCLQTRPIAGTRPRGDKDQDHKLQDELINHPKEQAEHIMLLDLERNDMGRICDYGSIVVDEVMQIESHPFVHHIVSNIRGALKPNIDIAQIISALFPGGTITGCPKIRCMEIINELEATNRGAYTGSLGYISDNGNMDFNILIRTLTKQKNILTLRAGAGIVFDSNPEKEAQETQHKADSVLSVFQEQKPTC